MPHIPKILLYTDTPLYGGAEKQMLLLAKNINPAKYKVIVVGRHSQDVENWYKELKKASIPSEIIKSRGKNSLTNLSKLNKIIKKHKPALIHAHLWNPVACKYAFAATVLNNIPLVTTEHDPFELKGHQKIYKNLTLNLTKRIITVSKANRELMNSLYPDQFNKIVTVHNGIEESKTHISEQQKVHIRKAIFHAGRETVIIFAAGTLHPRKGYKYLISAFKKVAAKVDNIKLVIAGSGPQKEVLNNIIKRENLEKKVILIGQRDDIERLMQASDIFVLPSIQEAFGLVILEAMQNGLPVIGSRIGGIPEIISSEEYGILVKPGQKDALAKALIKLINNDSLRNKLIQNGKSHWTKFSAKEMARKTEAVYYQALNL